MLEPYRCFPQIYGRQYNYGLQFYSSMKHWSYFAATLAALSFLSSCKEDKVTYPELAIDAESLSVEMTYSASVKILSGSGSYTVAVADPSVATAELDATVPESQVINVTPVAEGTTTLTVTDALSNEVATASLEVLPECVIKFHSAAKWNTKFTIDAAEEDRNRVWFDFNGNDEFDEGEDEIDFGNSVVYEFDKTKEYVTIHGHVSVFVAQVGFIDMLDVTAARYLKKLDVMSGRLESVDLSNNVLLEDLNISANRNLETVDFTPLKNLQVVNVSNTMIPTLDFSGNPELVKITCCETPVSGVVFPADAKIESVRFWLNDKLESFDTSKLPELKDLGLSGCPIKSLDLSANKKLEVLDAQKLEIETIDLKNNANLVKIFLDVNNLTDESFISSLPAPEKLEVLSLFYNRVTSLDLTKFTGLKQLSVYGNEIKLDEMTKLVNSLPQRTKADQAKIYIMTSARRPTKPEGNQVSENDKDRDTLNNCENIKTCTAKKWQAFDNNDGGSAIALNVIAD